MSPCPELDARILGLQDRLTKLNLLPPGLERINKTFNTKKEIAKLEGIRAKILAKAHGTILLKDFPVEDHALPDKYRPNKVKASKPPPRNAYIEEVLKQPDPVLAYLEQGEPA